MNFKIFFIFCIISSFLVSCKTSSSIVTSKREAEKLGIYKTPKGKNSSKTSTKNKTNKKESSDDIADKLIDKGMEFQGVPYKAGGTTTKGMDCSGFIIAAFSDYSVKLPRTSIEMSKTGNEIDKSDARKGDLIFFKTNGRNVINHVGLIIEIQKDEIKFIHSSTQKGVIVSSTKEDYYKTTFAKINRVIN